MKLLVVQDCEDKKKTDGAFVKQPKATFAVLEIPGDKLPEGCELTPVDRRDVDWEMGPCLVHLLKEHTGK